MHVYSSTGVASLTVVHVDSPYRPLHCLVDIGIRENDVLCNISAAGTSSRSHRQHTGLFPPSSKVTFLRLELAAALRIDLPVRVEPVNAILSMSMCCAIAAPTVLP